MPHKMCLQKELLCCLVLLLGLVAGDESSPLNTTDIIETLKFTRSGNDPYFLGVVKVNWYKALQTCRYYDMNLVSIYSMQEYNKLNNYIKDAGYWQEHFWTSGSDLAENRKFVWMANGRPLTFPKWHPGEPNNDGGHENCVEMWNKNNEGMKFNDKPCYREIYFVCE